MTIHPQERLSETPTDATTTTSESSPNLNDHVTFRTRSTTQLNNSKNTTTFGSEPRKSMGNLYEQMSQPERSVLFYFLIDMKQFNLSRLFLIPLRFFLN